MEIEVHDVDGYPLRLLRVRGAVLTVGALFELYGVCQTWNAAVYGAFTSLPRTWDSHFLLIASKWRCGDCFGASQQLVLQNDGIKQHQATNIWEFSQEERTARDYKGVMLFESPFGKYLKTSSYRQHPNTPGKQQAPPKENARGWGGTSRGCRWEALVLGVQSNHCWSLVLLWV